MKDFMGQDFLLDTPTAQQLFAAANRQPIFDWHCHLSAQEIYENKPPRDLAQLWLAGDHYKWRAMRSCGVAEHYITGDAAPYEKFLAWARVMPSLIGNPLYHWTHLELQRYFGIKTPLSEATAQAIWDAANAQIEAGGFEPRALIEKSNVTCLCTTDDPADTLLYHDKLAATDFACRVLPAFRPDKALQIELPGYIDWFAALEITCDTPINSYRALQEALLARINYFAARGCRASDHAFTHVPFARADENTLEGIFQKARQAQALTALEIQQYKTELLRFFAAEYTKRGWGMELHIGALRNNNTAAFYALGPDTGYDSAADYEVAYNLSCLLDACAVDNALPRTLLFTLNPKDNYVLGTMLGNFQTAEVPGKLQFGSAWWSNDHIDGMREQMKALANTGALATFVGMVTDSRSFLSYPRHEYFRRILCGLLGDWVEQGWYPNDLPALTKIVEDIAYRNAVNYFGVQL